MKKLHKIKPEPEIIKIYEISWHNPIVANTIAEAYDQVKTILRDLEELKKWEDEGKIKAECGDSSPSFQTIEVLDVSIEEEFQKIKLISYFENEDQDSEPEEQTTGKISKGISAGGNENE